MQTTDCDKALQKLKDRIEQKALKARRRLFMQRLQRVAAILLLPVMTLSAWLLWHGGDTQATVQYVDMYANPGMVASFALPDGTKVWLNGGSSLRFPAVFSGKKREVRMSGQGYFEVARNESQPFTVSTGASYVLEALGTSFNITAYEDEDVIETTLVEGSVRLLLMQNGKMAQRAMVPGEKVIYNVGAHPAVVGERPKDSDTARNAVAEVKTVPSVAIRESRPQSVRYAKVDPQYDIAWKDRQILFRNHPMEQVIRTLGRYYNVQFAVKNAKAMEPVITGKFSNEPLQQVMEYLKIASGIKYRIVPAAVENGITKPGVVEIWK
jgi:ferric-dicitrate binding protein FerR (iron transport regulator)